MAKRLEKKEMVTRLPLRAIAEGMRAYGGVYLSWGKYQDRLPRFQPLADVDDCQYVMDEIFGIGDREGKDHSIPEMGAYYFMTRTDETPYYHYFFADPGMLAQVETLLAEY